MSAHSDVRVVCSFAGSQELATQLEQGAPADVIATADERTMASVVALVREPRVFARNELRIAVAPGNPKGVAGLADLGRDDLVVVVAAPEAPAGQYAAAALAAADVSVDPVSLEDNVKGVVTKVWLGEADAGIVYVSDVAAADSAVDGVAIATAQNVCATYPIACVAASEHPRAAQAFVDFVLSADAQRIMRQAGFLPVAGP
jgi:molybdate transport system substrate-binding protein